jgi:alkaline phosphatase
MKRNGRRWITAITITAVACALLISPALRPDGASSALSKAKNSYAKSIKVTTGKLAPKFKKTKTRYTVTLPYKTARVKVTIARASSAAKVSFKLTSKGKYKKAAVKSGKVTKQIAVAQGKSKSVWFRITPKKGKARVYRVTMKRGKAPAPDPVARNIIYLIGDGMGYNHIRATEIYYGKDLIIDNTDYKGWAQTKSANAAITDSAAGGTALASGVKTNNGMVGMKPDGTEVDTIADVARAAGKSVGILTTARVTDATPACFSAHAVSRTSYAAIAQDQIDWKPDILWGALDPVYTPSKSAIQAAGISYITTEAEMNAVADLKKPVFGLFNETDLASALSTAATPSLSEMTDKALKLLSKDEDGFFVMIEEGHIDKASHAVNIALMMKHQLEFDAVLAKCKAFLAQNPDTVIVITADHETGGLTIPAGTTSGGITNALYTALSSPTAANHTAADVPVYIYGADADDFTAAMDGNKVMDNTKIEQVLEKIIH